MITVFVYSSSEIFIATVRCHRLSKRDVVGPFHNGSSHPVDDAEAPSTPNIPITNVLVASQSYFVLLVIDRSHRARAPRGRVSRDF